MSENPVYLVMDHRVDTNTTTEPTILVKFRAMLPGKDITDPNPEHIGSYEARDMKHYLPSLVVLAWYYGDTVSRMNVEYEDIFHLDLEKAERMVKTLRHVNRRLEKMAENLGPPQKFGDYVIRVGLALGVQGIITKDSKWTTHGYRAHALNEANWVVDRLLHRLLPEEA